MPIGELAEGRAGFEGPDEWMLSGGGRNFKNDPTLNIGQNFKPKVRNFKRILGFGLERAED